MSDIIVSASSLSGKLVPPPFKSEVIRILILAALCGTHPRSVINLDESVCDDIRSAYNAVERAFFADPNVEPIYVGESATLMRLMAPVMLALHEKASFRVETSLFRRNMSALQYCVGCTIAHCRDGIISFTGKVRENAVCYIDASGSSQFASGLLIACLIVPRLRVQIRSAASWPYIELTLDCIRRFGAAVDMDERGFYHCINNKLVFPHSLSFMPDPSYSANFAAANYLMCGSCNGPIELPVFSESTQADAAIDKLILEKDVSIKDSPDLFPLLCAVAALRNEKTVISGTDRLRDKESDRVASSVAMVRSLGGSISVFDDRVEVFGKRSEPDAIVIESFGDHRIVMAAAIASLGCERPVTICEYDCVRKSAPQFFNDFIELGGEANELLR